jgi:hypothetical protein
LLVTSLIALIIVIFIFYCIWCQFFNYEELVHRIFPVYKEGESQNVWGVFSPASGTVQKRVVFAAHYDSSFRFNLISKTDVGYGYFIVGGVLDLVVATVAYLAVFLESAFALDLTWLNVIVPVFAMLGGILAGVFILTVGKSPKFMFGAIAYPSKKTTSIMVALAIYNIIVDTLLFPWFTAASGLLRVLVLLALNAVPFFISLFLFLGRNAVVGALDNLSAVGVCHGIACTLAQ